MPCRSGDHDAVFDALAGLVAAGQVGDQLPDERRLAVELGVGRAVVRKALSRLDALGVISTRPQVGTFIVDGEGSGAAAAAP